MPLIPPRKVKPTLSITEMLASEATIANRKIMFLNWLAELHGVTCKREGEVERHLAELHPE